MELLFPLPSRSPGPVPAGPGDPDGPDLLPETLSADPPLLFLRFVRFIEQSMSSITIIDFELVFISNFRSSEFVLTSVNSRS
ncbi:hypothetical protein HanRHA438_Chr10g0467001 [Helianthus annuus]|nr:hypothetical protein HanRHA438_Chr10g0467001 [Helianthus annuus]